MKNFIQQMRAGTRPAPTEKLSIMRRGTPCGCPNAEPCGQAQDLPLRKNYRLRVGAPLVGARNQSQAGLTLIELIVVMIVISVALVGVMSVINYTTRHSADPVLRHQAIAIAEAYMEEIVLKDFCEPDQTPAECAVNPCPGSETSRDLYDNVCDYNGLADNGARNQNGQLITGLENYRVNVTVAQEAFGPSGATVDGLRIDVDVTDPSGQSLRLSSYRADY